MPMPNQLHIISPGGPPMSEGGCHQLFLTSLREAQARHPDLAELLLFYEELFLTQDAFMAGLDMHPDRAGRELDSLRLSEGMPQFTFEELLINGEDFMRLSRLMAALIIKHMAHAADREELPADETVLRTAQAIFESRNPLVSADTPKDLAALVAGFSLAPYLQRARNAVISRISRDVWQRPYCPVCGGKPSFAALEQECGTRILLCSRCSAEWAYARFGCAFCESTAEQVYYPGGDGLYRLYTCDVCKRYLKTIDCRQAGRPVYLPIECIVTVPMDIAAQEKGYRHY
jgi:FdhE protein